MADLWMPGAERQPEGNGGSMAGGPARACWHITWDSLDERGRQPGFDNIAGYLKNVNYAPHLMWDPWTGRIVQFYPANQSARALEHPAGTAETNRQGSVCIQIEVFFSPGAVRDGKRYDTVADTPCRGLPEIMAWLRSWGVADEWPSGWPAWSGNSRSLANWRTRSGHYGHCHVPANTHSDPGPMPRSMFTGQAQEEDDMPDYVSVGMKQAQDLPPNTWVTIDWGKEYSDSAHHHWDKGGPSVIVGPARYSFLANVQVEGLPVGTEMQARVFEVNEETGKVDSNGPIAEFSVSGGTTFVHYALPADTVNAKARVRFQVIHFGTGTGKVKGGFAKGFVWPTS